MTTSHALYMVFATDRPGMSTVRAAVREAHRAHLRQPRADGAVAVLGGPTLDAAGDMDGTLLVISAASVEAVQRFLDDDPYVRHDLFERVEIRAWRCGLHRPDLLPADARPDPAR